MLNQAAPGRPRWDFHPLWMLDLPQAAWAAHAVADLTYLSATMPRWVRSCPIAGSLSARVRGQSAMQALP